MVYDSQLKKEKKKKTSEIWAESPEPLLYKFFTILINYFFEKFKKKFSFQNLMKMFRKVEE